MTISEPPLIVSPAVGKAYDAQFQQRMIKVERDCLLLAKQEGDEQYRIAAATINEARATIIETQRELDDARALIEDVAAQHLPSEDMEVAEDGDFESAYIIMVSAARAYLANDEKEPDNARTSK